MRLILAIILVSLSAQVAAKNFDLNFSIKIDGNDIAHPRMILKEGMKGSILKRANKENIFLDVIAHDGKLKQQPGIMIDFSAGILLKDGSRKILARGKVLTARNEAATILMPQPNDREEVEITITAKEI